MSIRNGKIVLTGAAGLVGQNLLVELEAQGCGKLVAIDKHAYNLDILRELHPEVDVIQVDLAESGPWEDAFAGAQVVVQLHAQITGKHSPEFKQQALDRAKKDGVAIAARDLKLRDSQLYSWRQSQQRTGETNEQARLQHAMRRVRLMP